MPSCPDAEEEGVCVRSCVCIYVCVCLNLCPKLKQRVGEHCASQVDLCHTQSRTSSAPRHHPASLPLCLALPRVPTLVINARLNVQMDLRFFFSSDSSKQTFIFTAAVHFDSAFTIIYSAYDLANQQTNKAKAALSPSMAR